jgi:hypothetical protein
MDGMPAALASEPGGGPGGPPTRTHALPFPILGIDTDNGGEFINEVLIAYCEQEHLTFTRGRPYLKNDQCFVEPEKWRDGASGRGL